MGLINAGLGLSRLNLPFLVGTLFTRNRSPAVIVGFVAYTIGGWMFALLYYVLFASIDVGLILGAFAQTSGAL